MMPLVIGVVADCKMIGQQPFHAVGDKYLRGIIEGMEAVPLIIPALAEPRLLSTYLGMIDGLLLSGSPSNIEPHHYGGEPAAEPHHDPARDATTLPLIGKVIEADIPLLGICRGLQEINVALGGTLHQKVQDQPGLMDHREDPEQPIEVQYGLAHPVLLEADGLLARASGCLRAQVNSVHQQGVRQLAAGLQVEARTEDGLIEAFSLQRPDRFVLAVQWHPEWQVRQHPFYQSIFTAFKTACENRRQQP